MTTSYVKTFMLLAGLTALLMSIGFLMGGTQGAFLAFLVSAGMNLFSYWKSDSIVLSMHGAEEVDEATAPELYQMTRQLAERAQMPMPRVYVMHNPQPNAFATGRNPENAAVAVNTGLMQMLTREELAGVIAHELAHIKNRDTLIMTITATIAGAISMIANFAMFFGSSRENNNPLGVVGIILMAVLAPVAAMLVQMAISRSREYEADRIGGLMCGNPRWLAGALHKISRGVERIENETAEAHPATAHMFIINPLTRGGFDNLFSTHPNAENRIAALEELAIEMGTSKTHESPALQDEPAKGPWG